MGISLPVTLFNWEAGPVSYIQVYFLLLILLACAFGVSFLKIGSAQLIISLGIAVAKALLILYYFMHLKKSQNTNRIVAFAGVFWLMVLMSFSLTDYASRKWHPLPGSWPAPVPAEAGPLSR
jgi:cytochrome c oxidase subunit 4